MLVNKLKAISITLVVSALALVPLIGARAVPPPTTVVVTPSSPAGWFINPNGTIPSDTSGTPPATPNSVGRIVGGPGHTGSVEFQTKSAPGGKPLLIAPTTVAGSPLAGLSISYESYIAKYADLSPHLTHAINVFIDRDGNLATNTDRHTLVYEPCYNTPANCGGPVAPLNTWTTWSATASSKWWTTSAIPGTVFTSPGAVFQPLTTVLTQYPNAAITGIVFQAGQRTGGNPWNNFVGNLDNVTLDLGGVATTYDFELDDTTAVVKQSSLNGWTPTANLTSTTGFEYGPGVPPLGAGSGRMSVGANGNGASQFRNNDYAGVFLRDLTALSYSSYVQQDGSGGQAAYIILNVDHDNNPATAADLLFFEPVYQTPTFFPSYPQPALALNTWQTWDALRGGWWSVNGFAGAGPGTGVKSLATYLAAFPNARLAPSTAGGSVRLVAGFGAGAWDNFIGNVDAFRFGVNGASTIYNFEAEPVIVTCATGQQVSAGSNCQAAIPDLTGQIQVDGPVPGLTVTQSPAAGTLVGLGSTTVTLTATDSAGNSDSCQAVVTVVDDTAPVITLNPPNPQTVPYASTYVDPGATAADNCDGNLTGSIVRTGSVNTFAVGTYTLTYNVSDSAGNPAVTQTRTVIVGPNPPGSANDCKNGGWQTRTNGQGQPFRNQGQCIQYFNNGK